MDILLTPEPKTHNVLYIRYIYSSTIYILYNNQGIINATESCAKHHQPSLACNRSNCTDITSKCHGVMGNCMKIVNVEYRLEKRNRE
jgi:hypothetical protein